MDAAAGFPTFVTQEALALTDADLTPNGKLRSTEKAKANHLLRQLQLRLQYARLKVDHGWQKQRLNEVENLYFRQQKQGPDSSSSPAKPSAYPTTALLATPLDPQILAQSQPEDAASAQSSLSFKLPVAAEVPEAGASTGPTAAPTSTPYDHANANGSAQQWSMPIDFPTPSTSTQAPAQIPPPLLHDLSSWVHDDPVGPPSSSAASAPASNAFTTQSQSQFSAPPTTTSASTSTSTSTSRAQPLQQPFAPAPASLTYESFWNAPTSAVPLHPDSADAHWLAQMGGGGVVMGAGAGYAYAPAPTPTFAASASAPRIGNGINGHGTGNPKGKGRVAGGSVVKRKSPVVGHASAQQGYLV
ncbi:hypothetical protein K438DRAFT_1953065 [Mycena galopus ATCC 62051]|nr:hypothetical protein K438DRAFT_1953065 [Mycena galopus ATCC 62051]